MLQESVPTNTIQYKIKTQKSIEAIKVPDGRYIFLWLLVKTPPSKQKMTCASYLLLCRYFFFVNYAVASVKNWIVLTHTHLNKAHTLHTDWLFYVCFPLQQAYTCTQTNISIIFNWHTIYPKHVFIHRYWDLNVCVCVLYVWLKRVWRYIRMRLCISSICLSHILQYRVCITISHTHFVLRLFLFCCSSPCRCVSFQRLSFCHH